MNLSNTICRVHGHENESYAYYPILIVGAGESGIAMGCRLRQVLGFDQFRIFERQSSIGGTWWINKYPDVACDLYVRYSVDSTYLNSHSCCQTGDFLFLLLFPQSQVVDHLPEWRRDIGIPTEGMRQISDQ